MEDNYQTGYATGTMKLFRFLDKVFGGMKPSTLILFVSTLAIWATMFALSLITRGESGFLWTCYVLISFTVMMGLSGGLARAVVVEILRVKSGDDGTPNRQELNSQSTLAASVLAKGLIGLPISEVKVQIEKVRLERGVAFEGKVVEFYRELTKRESDINLMVAALIGASTLEVSESIDSLKKLDPEMAKELTVRVNEARKSASTLREEKPKKPEEPEEVDEAA